MAAATEPQVPFYFMLPASMAAELEARHAESTGLPNASRSAIGKASAGAYLVQLRQAAEARPATRQRLRSVSVPQHSARL